jgi:hypothetical protein
LKLALARHEARRKIEVANRIIDKLGPDDDAVLDEDPDAHLWLSAKDLREKNIDYLLEILDNEEFCSTANMARAFKSCGLSNALDGSEDHLITVWKQLSNARNVAKGVFQ